MPLIALAGDGDDAFHRNLEIATGVSFVAMLGVLGYIVWANRQPDYETPSPERAELYRPNRRRGR